MGKQEVIRAARERLAQAQDALDKLDASIATAMALVGIYELLIEQEDDFRGGGGSDYNVLDSAVE
jgi:hypothetical protein